MDRSIISSNELMVEKKKNQISMNKSMNVLLINVIEKYYTTFILSKKCIKKYFKIGPRSYEL